MCSRSCSFDSSENSAISKNISEPIFKIKNTSSGQPHLHRDGHGDATATDVPEGLVQGDVELQVQALTAVFNRLKKQQLGLTGRKPPIRTRLSFYLSLRPPQAENQAFRLDSNCNATSMRTLELERSVNLR